MTTYISPELHIFPRPSQLEGGGEKAVKLFVYSKSHSFLNVAGGGAEVWALGPPRSKKIKIESNQICISLASMIKYSYITRYC
jgi:hypothetical protein